MIYVTGPSNYIYAETASLHVTTHVLYHSLDHLLLIKLFISTSLSPAEVQDKMNLQKLRDRRWLLQPSCGSSGDGLYEGLEWLKSQYLGEAWEDSPSIEVAPAALRAMSN